MTGSGARMSDKPTIPMPKGPKPGAPKQPPVNKSMGIVGRDQRWRTYPPPVISPEMTPVIELERITTLRLSQVGAAPRPCRLRVTRFLAQRGHVEPSVTRRSSTVCHRLGDVAPAGNLAGCAFRRDPQRIQPRGCIIATRQLFTVTLRGNLPAGPAPRAECNAQ
jgi:hypothetical protein